MCVRRVERGHKTSASGSITPHHHLLHSDFNVLILKHLKVRQRMNGDPVNQFSKPTAQVPSNEHNSQANWSSKDKLNSSHTHQPTP